MEAISSIQVFILDKFVPFVILLGLLIFVHELGHFLVAKYYRVRVEVFSLGFGKKILKFVKGHTTYCISLIPLGGYVKMFGDDPSAEIPEDQKKDSFLHKPVGQRIAIVLAGPLMNFFFAIFLFASVGLNGKQTVGPIVGDVEKDTQAWELGFRPGDTIKNIGNVGVSTWKEVDEILQKNGNQNLVFEIQREGRSLQLSATPALKDNPDIFQWEQKVGQIEGLSPAFRASVVGVASKSSIAYQSGLRSLDEVTELNGKKIKTWKELIAPLEKPEKAGDLKIKVTREEKVVAEVITLKIDQSMIGKPAATNLAILGIEISDLYINFIAEQMPAAAAGIKKGDKILSINGKKMMKWDDVLNTVNSYKSGDAPMKFNLVQNGHPRVISVVPKEKSVMNRNGQKVTRYQVGIGPALFRTYNPVTVKSSGPIEAVKYGVTQTLEWTNTIIVSFVRMFQAKVSTENIGSVLMIGQLASDSFKMGLSPYLTMMAVISINLFLINLLPIPLLDGGHLLFFSIEALRGAPVSLKKVEKAQQIGLILLMGLMAYAFYNDITRIVGAP